MLTCSPQRGRRRRGVGPRHEKTEGSRSKWASAAIVCKKRKTSHTNTRREQRHITHDKNNTRKTEQQVTHTNTGQEHHHTTHDRNKTTFYFRLVSETSCIVNAPRPTRTHPLPHFPLYIQTHKKNNTTNDYTKDPPSHLTTDCAIVEGIVPSPLKAGCPRKLYLLCFVTVSWYLDPPFLGAWERPQAKYVL